MNDSSMSSKHSTPRDPAHGIVGQETHIQQWRRGAFTIAIENWHRTQAAIRAANYMRAPEPRDHTPLFIDPLFVWGFN
jgi:hypothetical protein